MLILCTLFVTAPASNATASCRADSKCHANEDWAGQATLYEYTSNANPPMAEVPVHVFPPTLHQEGPTRVIPLDLKKELDLEYAATSPNLLASFLRIRPGEELDSGVEWATSQSFYVIRGNGSSLTRDGRIEWEEGDLFVLPYLGDSAPAVCETGRQCLRHFCSAEPRFGGCAIYWVHDEPLLRYLGVRPGDVRRFEPALYAGRVMRETVDSISPKTETGEVRNRRGILLANPATPQTKTLTPTLWSLLNSIDGDATQKPHKHNSVALDLAVSGGEAHKVYSLLGRSLDSDGKIVDSQRAEWQSGGVFVTPPGWWHSHHNEGSERAWVLPIQDAGLYTHQRTLDIRFEEEESARLQQGINRGATIDCVDCSSKSANVRPLVAGTLSFFHP
jgi:gentisate 1,2-dioxygenase